MLQKLTLSFIFLVLIGCSNKIILDSKEADKVEVLLIDYGYHSSLVLETDKGDYWEFTYGDWEWFAKDRSSWWRLPKTLFWPTTSTLARANFKDRDSFFRKRSHFKIEVYSLYAIPEKADDLINRLNQIFQENALNKQQYQKKYGLHFTPLNSESYHVFRNCNHLIVRWIEELGHEVKGSRIFSSWNISKAD